MSDLLLFRREALENKRDTWLGEILLVRPTSFAFLTGFFIVVALAILAYLIWGEYTKKARVTGYVVPEQGVIKVFAQQTGAVSVLRVKEGQTVKRGEVLMVLSVQKTSSQGSAQAEIEKQLAVRRSSLQREIRNVKELHVQHVDAAESKLSRLTDEREHIQRTIDGQRQRVRLAEVVFERNEKLYRDRYISELSLQDKRGEFLDQQNKLQELLRSHVAIDREAVALKSELQGLPVKLNSDLGALERSISEIAASSVDNESRREEYVTAPQDGLVTALQTNVGKLASPSQPLMTLIPAGTRLVVDLYVPSRAVGFVRSGNEARLQYQAFPYQKFGSHPGQVTKVSRTAVAAQELPFPAPSSDVFYVVTVEPELGHVLAYGKQEPLQSGMQVNADIWLDRRTLIEWIAEPLFSVSGRL